MEGEREIHVDRSPAHCPYCKGAFEDRAKIVACAACGARHHDACRAEHGRCATCGETDLLAPRPLARASVLEPPRGSCIAVSRDPDGVRLRFPGGHTTELGLRGSRPNDSRVALRLGLGLLALAAVAGVWMKNGLAVVLAIFGVLATAMGTFFRELQRPPLEIVLGSSLEFATEAGLRKCSRGDVGHIRTERAGNEGGYRLTVDVGIERVVVDLGNALKPPEVDWIADAIQAWKNEA